MNIPELMTHLVAGYPTMEASRTIAHALVRGGAAFLEVQFPYTDPTADGPLIQAACTKALEAGFSTAAGFELVSRLAAETLVPIFLMSYAGLVCAGGVAAYVDRAADAGVRGLIVPDLPVDSDEGLLSAAARRGLAVVPVVVPHMSVSRRELVAGLRPPYVYAALRGGITGQETTIGEENISFLKSLREITPHLMAGFGIRSTDQLLALAPYVDTAIVGSAIVDAIAGGWERGGADGATSAAESLLVKLRGGTPGGG